MVLLHVTLPHTHLYTRYHLVVIDWLFFGRWCCSVTVPRMRWLTRWPSRLQPYRSYLHYLVDVITIPIVRVATRRRRAGVGWLPLPRCSAWFCLNGVTLLLRYCCWWIVAVGVFFYCCYYIVPIVVIPPIRYDGVFFPYVCCYFTIVDLIQYTERVVIIVKTGIPLLALLLFSVIVVVVILLCHICLTGLPRCFFL